MSITEEFRLKPCAKVLLVVSVLLVCICSGCSSSDNPVSPMSLFATENFINAKEREKVLNERSWLGFSEPEVVREKMGLQFRGSYQPGKIPVVLVHGLLSDTLTWHEMLTQLEGDSNVSQRYQFWTFRYPTGDPYLKSAAGLRRSLVSARNKFDPQHVDPALDQMVLVGHSMGGLVSKLQVTHSDERILKAFSNVPIQELAGSYEARQSIREMVEFDPLPFVRRVVYIATPHRGSYMTDYVVGPFGKKFIEFPEKVREEFEQLVSQNDEALNFDGGDLPTSIDHLSPSSPVMKATGELTYAGDVEMHSIIGLGHGIPAFSRGDGFVSRKSAALDTVVSEKFVRASHTSAHRDKESIEEVRRILREH